MLSLMARLMEIIVVALYWVESSESIVFASFRPQRIWPPRLGVSARARPDHRAPAAATDSPIALVYPRNSRLVRLLSSSMR